MSRSSARAVISAERKRTGKVDKKHRDSRTFGLEVPDGEVIAIVIT